MQYTNVMPEMLYLRILIWGGLCCYIGRSVGRIVDIQYRNPEGKPNFIKIPAQKMWMFHFRYFLGNAVVKEGLIIHICGYLFSLLEVCIFILAVIFKNELMLFVEIADWIILFLGSFVFLVVLLPMYWRYERNLQIAYDRDWITYLQNALTIYPKRKCKIVSQIDSTTYEITLVHGRKRRLAKADISVSVGSRMYAVHSYEHGSPFWTIIDH